MLCLRHHRLGLTQRLDLPCPEHAQHVVSALLPSLVAENPDSVILIGYENHAAHSLVAKRDHLAVRRSRPSRLRHLFALERLTLKEAPYLESLSGLSGLPMLEKLGVFLTRKLHHISDIAGLASSLRDLEFEDCPGIAVLDDVEPLVNLRFRGVSVCGDVESLGPIRGLDRLEEFYAWGIDAHR